MTCLDSGSHSATTFTAIRGASNAMSETNTTLAGQRRLLWRTAEVRQVIDETSRVRSLVLNVLGWPTHRPGQHVDVRLTAEDGYQAQRSYSIASAPEAPQLTLTVERIDDGEVSPYLATEVRVVERFKVSGSIGAYSLFNTSFEGT